MIKSNDTTVQRIHGENEDRICLARFVAGLTGVPGRQVRFASPQTMQQALSIALSVTEAEKQEKSDEIFLARTDKPLKRPKRGWGREKRESGTNTCLKHESQPE